MSQTFSAQNSITIKRERNGENLTLSFLSNGKPLYQAVDSTTGLPTPDWETDANRPVVTPKVTSAQASAATLSQHTWYYNGSATPLAFTDTVTDATYNLTADGTFGLNPSTGALKIFKNLASSVNIANDSLTYEGVATVSGLEYNVRGELTITIQSGGANAYYAWIAASNGVVLDRTVTTTRLTANLLYGGATQTLPGSYAIKWYKDNQEISSAAGSTYLDVGRDDVDGTQLFIVKILSGTDVIAAAGITVADAADEYTVNLAITSTNTLVSPGNPVTVQASMVNMTTGATVTASDVSAFAWVLSIYNKTSWTVIRDTTSTAAQPTIQVTTTETDNGAVYNDVDVVGEVTITI